MLNRVLLIGLLGSLLMFCGDMLLYYDPNDYKNNGTLEPIIQIMKNLPAKRVMIAGLIGPVAAFLYCIGFYHIVFVTNASGHMIAFISFLLCCFGIITGGAYHSHCAYLGLLGKDDQRKDLNIVISYFQKMPIILYLGEGLGLILFIYLIVTGQTIYPRWLAILSPGVLFLLKPIAVKLPKGIHVIVSGGFSNLVFVVYYLVAIITVL